MKKIELEKLIENIVKQKINELSNQYPFYAYIYFLKNNKVGIDTTKNKLSQKELISNFDNFKIKYIEKKVENEKQWSDIMLEYGDKLDDSVKIGLPETAIKFKSKNILKEEDNSNIQIDDLIEIDWWYPSFNGRPFLNKIYKLIATDKLNKEHKFKTGDAFNRYFEISAPYAKFDDFKDFMQHIHKGINIIQSEFDVS
jgi:hypothetical protein